MFFTSEKWLYGKPRHPWHENWWAAFLFSRCRKGLWTSVQLTILLQSKKTKPHYKTPGDVKLVQTLLGTRNELRKVEEIPAVELNEYICEFIISVRTKDCEPSSLWSLLASFEGHLKREQLLCQYHEWSHIWEARKVLLSKQKELEKKGKGNRTNASIALKSMWVNKTHFIVLSLLIVISLLEWNLSTYKINK